MDRRAFIQLFAAASALSVLPVKYAHAAWNPRRPLNVIVPYSAGGGVDAYARAISAVAADSWPVPVVVVNKDGAAGVAGATAAAAAKPDGNTIMITSSGSLIMTAQLRDTSVDLFEDFQTIAQVGRLSSALFVPASSPFQSAVELVDYAKANPGKLRWGHVGRGSFHHVAGQSFLSANALETVDVPFKGGAKVRAAVIGAQVDFGFIGVNTGRGFENEMRALGVVAPKRDTVMKDVPTFAEQGLEWVDISSPITAHAPNGVDPEIVAGIQDALKEIVEGEKFNALMEEQGNAGEYLSGEVAEADLRKLQELTAPIIASIKPEQ